MPIEVDSMPDALLAEVREVLATHDPICGELSGSTNCLSTAETIVLDSLLSIIYLEDPLQRDFYAEMCRIERWSTRTLQDRIRSMLFERTALSKRPQALIERNLKALREKDRVTPDLIFRDRYVLDFLNLKDSYSEQDLENALLREIESFLLELGTGFAFIERQKRISLDGDDYYLDLLFFHRRLSRLIAVELKLGEFKPADSGQMELYLRWLDRHERQRGEGMPLGLILCAGKKNDTIELLELAPRGIHVAAYLTALPARELLQQRLRDAMIRARSRLEVRPTTQLVAMKRCGSKGRTCVSSGAIGDREQCDPWFEEVADFGRVHRPAAAQYSGDSDDTGVWIADIARSLLWVEAV